MRGAIIAAAMLVAGAAAAQPQDRALWLGKHDHFLDPATAEAKRTLPIFWKHVANDPQVESALIKVGFPTAHGGVEFLWVALIKPTENGVLGEIVNEPEDVPNVHAGQPYEAKVSEIVDWAYLKHGKSYGQLTTRVLNRRADSREFREASVDLAPTALEPGDR